MPRVPAKSGKPTKPGIVGTNLRRLRKAHVPKLSKAELARMAGVASSTISNIELGYIVEPNPVTIGMLAKALGVTMADLIEEHGQSALDEEKIAEFKASPWYQTVPGGPVTEDEIEWLRSFPPGTWGVLPPNPESLHHMILAARRSPDLRKK